MDVNKMKCERCYKEIEMENYIYEFDGLLICIKCIKDKLNSVDDPDLFEIINDSLNSNIISEYKRNSNNVILNTLSERMIKLKEKVYIT